MTKRQCETAQIGKVFKLLVEQHLNFDKKIKYHNRRTLWGLCKKLEVIN